MKQGHVSLFLALGLWLLGHFKLRIFRLSIWHPELECIALSFLLEWKLGVKGNRLNRNGSEK